MDRLDFAFSALVVAAVAVVLGWSLVEVSRIRSLDPSKPAPDAELSGGVTRGAHQH